MLGMARLLLSIAILFRRRSSISRLLVLGQSPFARSIARRFFVAQRFWIPLREHFVEMLREIAWRSALA